MNISRLLDLAVELNIPPSSYLWEWNEYAEWQFRLLSRHMQVKPSHHLLDIGCGALRLGHLAIPYLDDDHYCGIDPFAPFVELGHRLMAEAGETKTYRLHLSDQFDFEVFGRQFDFAIAQSVLGHLSVREIRQCLQALKAVMKPGGEFYATVGFGGRSRQRIGFFYGGTHPFRHAALHDLSFWQELAEEFGLGFELTDIPHPAQKVIVLRFPGVQGGADERDGAPAPNVLMNSLAPGASDVDAALSATVDELARYLRVPHDTVAGLIDRAPFTQAGAPAPDSEADIARLFDSDSYLVDNALNNVRKAELTDKAALRLAAARIAIADSGGNGVLDYGAGSGALSLLLAGLGAGRLCVAEVSDRLLDFVTWRLEDRGFDTPDAWNILRESRPPRRYGAALVIDVFPVIKQPTATVERIAASLVEGGRAVVNLAKVAERGREKWNYLVGLPPAEVKQAFVNAGFSLLQEDVYGRHSLCVFRNDAI